MLRHSTIKQNTLRNVSRTSGKLVGLEGRGRFADPIERRRPLLPQDLVEQSRPPGLRSAVILLNILCGFGPLKCEFRSAPIHIEPSGKYAP